MAESAAQIMPQVKEWKVHLLMREESEEEEGKMLKLPANNIKQLSIDPKLAEETAVELRQIMQGKAWRLECVDGAM